MGISENEIMSARAPVIAPIKGPKIYPVNFIGNPPAINLKLGREAIGAILVKIRTNTTLVAIKIETNEIFLFVHILFFFFFKNFISPLYL